MLTRTPVPGSTTGQGQNREASALYTAEEAAEILRVRKSWLERQAAARKIPFTMLGGSYRFTTGHLSQIVRLFEVTPEPASRVPAARGARRAALRRDTAAEPAAPLRPRPRSGPRRRGQAALGPDLAI